MAACRLVSPAFATICNHGGGVIHAPRVRSPITDVRRRSLASSLSLQRVGYARSAGEAENLAEEETRCPLVTESRDDRAALVLRDDYAGAMQAALANFIWERLNFEGTDNRFLWSTCPLLIRNLFYTMG